MSCPNILVVHGVAGGTNADLAPHKQIEALVRHCLNEHGVQHEFTVDVLAYDGVTDSARAAASHLLRALTLEEPLLNTALESIWDVVGDVTTAAVDGSTARKIRIELREKILSGHRAGQPQLVIAHSLGSIYAFDVLCQLMKEPTLFQGDVTASWPCCGFVTLGSPLGLPMFKRKWVARLRDAQFAWLAWENYWSRFDPVVSGHAFGTPVQLSATFAGPVEMRLGKTAAAARWDLQPNIVASGRPWLAAHNAYWTHPKLGDAILPLLWG